MKACPTSNMNKSQMWGFEVSHIVASFVVLASTNVGLNILKAPLFLSWVAALAVLLILRIISHGQKTGHLDLLVRYLAQPHIYLGHQGRSSNRSTQL
jgi:hypothetical protein